MFDAEVSVFHSEMSRLMGKSDLNSSSAEESNALTKLRRKLTHLREEEVTDDNEIRELFWDEFSQFIEGLDPHSDIRKKVIDKWEVPIVWGWWSWLHEDISIPHGFSPKHVGMFQGPSNPSGRHVYRARPKRIKWRIHPVMEGDKVRFYTATAPICEIDAVSSVPYIREGMTIWEASKRVINPRLKATEWQRGLDSGRIVSIRSFLDNPQNSFSNACMIFAPDHSSIDWEDDANGIPMYLYVDFQFLKEDPVKKAPYMTDHSTTKDLRPLSIIDGQHRVRGGMRSYRGFNLEIPIILFPPELKNRGAAKYFAEVNTLSEPLNVLHELFMRHKFGLGSNKMERTYARYDGTRSTYRDRANRLAYETAAYLNLNYNPEDMEEGEDEFGALYFLIRILQENTREKNYVIAADMWVKHSYQWFMPGGAYPPPTNSGTDDKEAFFKEVANFFDAFMAVCNEGWSDGNKRWLTWESLQAKDSNGKRPYIQYNTSVRALLVNYPLVVKMIRDTGYKNKVITRKRFKKTLKVWGNIDWLDSRLKTHYIGTGEPPWNCLKRWMMDTLQRGEEDPHPVSEVMNATISSERGKGILSPISSGAIDFSHPAYTWPHPNDPLSIVAERPINARRGCKVHLVDSKFKELNQKAGLRVTHSAKPDSLTIEIEHWDGIEDYDELFCRVTWGTTIDKSVSSLLKLRK
jgi:hypothetical protein